MKIVVWIYVEFGKQNGIQSNGCMRYRELEYEMLEYGYIDL